MLRLVGFFLLAYVALRVLQAMPFVGPFFRNVFAFWIVCLGLGLALTRLSQVAVQRRRQGAVMRELQAVDSPYNRGKLGALLLSQSRPAAAVPHLEQALAGDPESLEWGFRLGCALLAADRAADAVERLRAVAERDEEYAYGAVQLRLAEALTRSGRPDGALEALDRFDRNHGESPESAFRRGAALRASGARDPARAAFSRVPVLARNAAGFQRGQNRAWVWRAFLARLV